MARSLIFLRSSCLRLAPLEVARSALAGGTRAKSRRNWIARAERHLTKCGREKPSPQRMTAAARRLPLKYSFYGFDLKSMRATPCPSMSYADQASYKIRTSKRKSLSKPLAQKLWLPFVGNYRTFINLPSIDHPALFQTIATW